MNHDATDFRVIAEYILKISQYNNVGQFFALSFRRVPCRKTDEIAPIPGVTPAPFEAPLSQPVAAGISHQAPISKRAARQLPQQLLVPRIHQRVVL